MSSTNPITGDNLVSKVGNQEKYSEGYDRIFKNKENSSANGITKEDIIYAIRKAGLITLSSNVVHLRYVSEEDAMNTWKIISKICSKKE